MSTSTANDEMEAMVSGTAENVEELTAPNTDAPSEINSSTIAEIVVEPQLIVGDSEKAPDNGANIPKYDNSANSSKRSKRSMVSCVSVPYFYQYCILF